MNLSIPLGYYATTTPTSGTSVPDISDMLELWAHKETPFLNRLSWGSESSAANSIEWLTEHIMTRRGLPLAAYEMRHDLENQPANLKPLLSFEKIPLNTNIVPPIAVP